MRKNKKKFNSKLNLILIITSLIFLLVVSILIIYEMGLVKRVNSSHFVKTDFAIIDECSLIAGKIIHPIDREEECANKCLVNCEVQNLDFANSTFVGKENSCNICQCVCK